MHYWQIPLDTRPEIYDSERGAEFGQGARLQSEKEAAILAAAQAAAAGSAAKKPKKEKVGDGSSGQSTPMLKSLKLRSEVVPGQTVYMAGSVRSGAFSPALATPLRRQIPRFDRTRRDRLKTFLVVFPGALYLHPLALQMQLRPSLDYLTALDEQSKEERRRERAGEGDEDSEDEKKEEVAKAVAVRPVHLLLTLQGRTHN